MRAVLHSFALAGLFGTVLLASSMAGYCGDWKPDPSLGNPEQHLRLYHIGRRWGDEHYDDKMALIDKDPWKHHYMIRESAYYACGLLMTGDPAERERAERIIRQVLTKQDQRPDKPSYGSFLWSFSENWETVGNVDLNYGQFVGMALAHFQEIDNQQGHVVSADLRKEVEKSFRLAVEQTIRRDVDPGYTNISLLSAAVCVAGDTLMKIPGAKDFAMSKLSWFLSRALPGATLREYLAPTYFGGDLSASYEVKAFATTPEVKDAANRIIDFLWKDIAASYHAPTYQLSGPHSRAYGENMLKYTAGLKYMLYLALDGKYPINDTETKHTWDLGGLVLTAGLPVDVRANDFNITHPAWREVVVDRNLGMAFRQYRKGDFIVGSISSQSLWNQQRSVVAYWPIKTPSFDVAYCMDMSAATMGNGSARYRSVQSEAAVLAAITTKITPTAPRGGLRFAFNLGAKPEPMANGPAGAVVVHDGDVTTYIYPVTKVDGSMTFQSDADMTYVDRLWTAADTVGQISVLSYLVVFQLPGEPVPVVKNISFNATEQPPTVSAEVNGKSLSVDAK